MKPRIGIYLRISFDDEGEGLGVARQEEDCRAVVARRGWDVAGVYVDNNKSAFRKNVFRKDFERLLKDLRSGVLDGFATYDIDRLARQPRDGERIIDIYEDSGRPFAAVTNELDLSTPDGIFMFRLMVSIANKSSKDTSRRTKRKNQERWEKGLPHGSRRPYGYDDDMMTLHAVEAPIFKEVGRKFLSGWSYKEIAYWMNEQDYKTTLGRLWYPITISNMLKKERYAGLHSRGGVTKAGKWEPLFTPDEWAMIQHRMAERRKAAGNPPVAKKYTFTGLLVCGQCGSYLNGETKRDHPSRPIRRTYRCRPQGDTKREGGCGGVTRDAVALEHFIREAVIFRLDTPDLGGLISKSSETQETLKELLEQLSIKASRKLSLLDDYTDGTISKADYQRASQRVQMQADELDRQIDEIKRKTFDIELNTGESIRDAWNSRPDGWKLELASLLIKQVTVKPGISKPFYIADGVRKRFDPELIDIDWLV